MHMCMAEDGVWLYSMDLADLVANSTVVPQTPVDLCCLTLHKTPPCCIFCFTYACYCQGSTNNTPERNFSVDFRFYKQYTCKKDFSIGFGNMPRRMVDATEVQPGERGWTCIIQVVERHPILYKAVATHPFQKRYRNFLLTDMKGTKIKAVMFDNDIDFHERSMQPFKRYQISNAIATLPQERYQLVDYKFSWTITARTPVEPILDKTPYPLPCKFEVCKFAELHKFAESDTNISIRGLIVHQFPVLEISNPKCAKDYVVVNEEEIPIVLRLWKDFLADYDPNIDNFRKEPVTIITSNLAVKTFHGLSLATRTTTYMLQNPPCLKIFASKNGMLKIRTRLTVG